MSDTPRLKLYNTLTRQKEVFEPIDANNVRMYVCGPTVYDFAHIGNARPVIVFDVLNRLLRHLYGNNGTISKGKVTYVRNITDVEDKINARALRDYPDLPLNDAIARVTQTTASQFQADVKALGCLEPDHEPRATQHITGMVRMIETLIDKGHAYQAGGEVLFDVSSMPNYGKLSNRKLEDQRAGARVATKDHKKNPGDFVLWKLSTDNQPGWPSPWGVGRPGWHIECSVMSEHHLGKTFDIHGGGLDLIFPHHENEIAQSCCAHDNDRMANVWMHNGFLQVEGRKMSKSDGNFVTIQELLETEKFGGRKWPGEVLRLAMLMTHYREPIDFSVAKLEMAQSTLSIWKEAMSKAGLSWREGNREYYEEFSPSLSTIEALSNDLNTSQMIADIHRLSKSSNTYDGHTMFATLSFLGLMSFSGMQEWEVFQDSTAVTDWLNHGQMEEFISKRLTHIANKNWAAADAIRDELLSQGIQLKDGKNPETGERVTTWEVKQ